MDLIVKMGVRNQGPGSIFFDYYYCCYYYLRERVCTLVEHFIHIFVGVRAQHYLGLRGSVQTENSNS